MTEFELRATVTSHILSGLMQKLGEFYTTGGLVHISTIRAAVDAADKLLAELQKTAQPPLTNNGIFQSYCSICKAMTHHYQENGCVRCANCNRPLPTK